MICVPIVIQNIYCEHRNNLNDHQNTGEIAKIKLRRR